MTPTATQPCTAMVAGGGLFPRPCGVPVAELGPCAECKKTPDDDWQPWHSAEANANPDDWHGLAHEPAYALVHVTLGPCEFVERFDNEFGHHEVVCGEDPIEGHPHQWSYVDHEHAPTVTELPSEHEAEVSDG